MQHPIELSGDVRESGDVVPEELERRIPREVRDVVGVAGDEVVEPDDAMPFGNEAIDEVRS
jgi:hypothetical protein